MDSEKVYAIKNAGTLAIATHEGILVSCTAMERIQTMCAYVKRNQDGTIEKEFIDQSITAQFEDYKKNNTEEDIFVTKSTVRFQLIFSAILALIAIFGGKIVAIFSIVLWVSMYISSALYNIAYTTSIALYHHKHPSLSKYHGAEHMAFQAYIKLNRLPTIEEIASGSKFDNNCTSVDTSLKPTVLSILNSLIIVSTLVPAITLVLYGLNNWQHIWGHIIIIFMIIFFIAFLNFAIERIEKLVQKGFASGFLTKLTQWTVVKTPSASEIQVAQEAIKVQQEMDKMIANDQEGFEAGYVDFHIGEKKAIYTYPNGAKHKTTLKEYISSIQALQDAVKVDANDVSTDS